ncbi:sigma-54-dependent Fis family transcriptional regulator [Polycladomyces subterraneus]|uniref:Sigma 54-interacting transcriptional regulator n=1 Tax=Polycladomyces subterraneus TaxID=1016997 RepID=A0ABT8ILJ0_9BACL|nr:sigma-54-dependent Fis family transcriptional regulator [Polycladomyces subterraneus]MDN4593054.1 sigma 54-interacting transcriptional regulator [Polycladomyces subterraneus]
MKIADDYMQQPIVLRSYHKVSDVLKAFLKHRLDIACVLDERDKLVGIVSKYALYRALLKGADLNSSITPLIRKEVVTLDAKATIHKAKDVLLSNDVGHGVVVDEGGRVQGTMGKSDIIRGFLHHSELLVNQLTSLIEHLQDGVIAIDSNLRVVIFNHAAESMFGISRKAVIGETIHRCFPELGPDLEKTLVDRALAKPRQKKIGQNTVIASFIPISYFEERGGAMAVLQDVTALEAIAQELESTKNLQHTLQHAVAQSYDGIIITDTHGRIAVANDAFLDLFDLKMEEVRGKPWSEVVPECSLETAMHQLKIKREVKTVRGKTCVFIQEPIIRSGKHLGVIAKIIFHQLEQWRNVFRRIEQLESERDYYRDQYQRITRHSDAFNGIISLDPAMERLKKEASLAARSASTVIITGESGTGKELFAEAIHRESGRPGQFIKVNCAAVPAELLESEFFGYAEGAFTGARRGGKPGKFELADKGTLFLDEIGDMPLSLQAKLLRVLQEQAFERVGDVKTRKVDVRIIAATNKNLEQMVREGSFREDLYYRINVIHLHIPPLRERMGDFPVLCEHLIKKLNKKMNKHVIGITPQALSLLQVYSWPGNVRQLENVIERAMNMELEGWIEPEHLPEEIRLAPVRDAAVSSDKTKAEDVSSYHLSKESWERHCILEALKEAKGSRTKAARLLGVSRSTLYYKMRKLGIKSEVEYRLT